MLGANNRYQIALTYGDSSKSLFCRNRAWRAHQQMYTIMFKRFPSTVKYALSNINFQPFVLRQKLSDDLKQNVIIHNRLHRNAESWLPTSRYLLGLFD